MTLATTCPFCMTMLRDGLADIDAGRSVRTLDIAEILADVVVTALWAAQPGAEGLADRWH